MSDQVTQAPAVSPAPVSAEAPAAPVIHEPAQPQPSKRDRIAAKREQRRDPKHVAEQWARAGRVAAAKEGAEPAPAPAGAPAKDPETGKFLPRAAKPAKAPAKAPAAAPAEGSVITAPEVETTAEPAAPEAPKPAEGDRTSKRSQLEALAKELGFHFDGRAVAVKDRYELREEARRRQEAFQKQTAAEKAAFEAERAKFADEAKRVKAFEAALEEGDFDGMAAAIGRKEWNELQNEVFENVANPTTKEIKRLRAEIEADKKAKAKEAEEAQTRTQREHQQRLIHNAKVAVSQEAAQAKDPLLKALHWDPLFVDSLYDIQAQHYDHVTETTIPLEEAIDLPIGRGADGQPVTLRAHMKRFYDSLKGAFEALPPPRPVVPAAAPAKAPAAPRVTTPRPAAAPEPTPRAVRMGREDRQAAAAPSTFAEQRMNKVRERQQADAERIARFTAGG